MTTTTRVLILVADGTEVSEFAAIYDVLGWAREEAGLPLEMTVAGPSPVITCTFGLRLHTDILLHNVEPKLFDAVAVPGGFGDLGFFDQAFSEEFLRPIRAAAGDNKPVAAVCTGALALAKAGVLQDRRATTYHLGEGVRRKQLADLGAIVEDAPLVVDGRIVTSTGPATAFDVAFWLVDQVCGSAATHRLRWLMGFSGRPLPG